VSGSIVVTACAADNGGIAGVQFKVDGTSLGAEDIAPPYSITWDTTSAANGSRTLTAVARDRAGNAATSAALAVTVSNASPSVSIASPAAHATVHGTISVTATASAGTLGVQFVLDGSNLNAEDVTAPYATTLDTSALVDGAHTLRAVARDAAGRLGTSPSVAFTTANGVVRVSPQDTSLNLDAANYSTSPQLTTYTWPSQQVANAIVMKFDLSIVPAGSVIQSAVLRLALIGSDTTSDPIYTITAHRILDRNPVVSAATGYTSDGVTPWAANACCYANVPLAQADVSSPYDTQAIDKTPGYKTWTITSLVQEWVSSPSTNFGVLLDSDASKSADRFRTFASMEHSDATLRPYLQLRYTAGDGTPPVLSAVAAVSIGTSSATITWISSEASDSQVDYGATSAYGSSTSLATPLVTAHGVVISGLSPGTDYHYRVRSRDASGTLAVSPDATFRTLPLSTAPWPHEPAGFVPYTDWSLTTLAASGWNTVNSNGYAAIVSDAAAPVSAPTVGQWKYPVGFAGGTAPATMYYPLPTPFDEGFVGFAWKASNPWQGHLSYVNKIMFLQSRNASCGNLYMTMYGPPGGPYDLRVAPEWGNWNWLTPNATNVPVSLGAWHKIELYFKYNTAGQSNGIVRWWMDGTPVGNYTNLSFHPSGCFGEYQLSPTWGGVTDAKTETDYFWYDHVYISKPGG
jgi:hypothetical protein